MKETNIVQTIRLGCNDIAILWRNNTGALKDAHGRLVRYGLCVGSPDLVGMRIGDGKLIALEVKQPGKKPTSEQVSFLNAVKNCGGLAGVATNLEEARKIILNEC